MDPGEEVLWSGKPDRKATVLKGFGASPVALFIMLWVLAVASMPGSIIPFSPLPLFLLFFIIIVVCVVAPLLWQLKKTRYAEFMITNKRLLIKSGITESDVWFTGLDAIKNVVVHFGISDKILGTGSLYPMTVEYPYSPKLRSFRRLTYLGRDRSGARLVKVWNFADQRYEGVSEKMLWRTIFYHPHLWGLKETFPVQKLLREAIFGFGTYYVNCRYCDYRYDLNKEEKCPHCGGPKYYR